MDGAVLVQTTTYLSIFIQLLTGFFGFLGIHYRLPEKHAILTDALKIELIVQLIELFFYVFLVIRFNLKNMAMMRYYDWFITTPTMLFTTILVYTYLNTEQKLTLKGFMVDHWKEILAITVSNFLMLLMGFLGELGMISMEMAFGLGFIFLFMSFWIIYQGFAKYLKQKILFGLLVVIWSFYGIVFLFSDVTKNTVYNFLDIVAKNFFGLYLYWKIRDISKNNK